MSGGARPRSTFRRRWRSAALALAWSSVFVGCLLLGLFFHGNVPALRRSVTSVLNRSLEDKFRGRWVLGPLQRLGLAHTTLSRLELLDERGSTLVSLEGVQLSYRPWRWIAPLLFGSDAPLRLEHVRVERSRIALSRDPESGRWTLQRALESPRPPSTKPKRPPLHYTLAAVELGELQLSVDDPSLGHIEATLQHVQGSAELAGADTSVDVQRFGLRLLAGKDLPLEGTGSLRILPHGTASCTFHGFLDGTEIDAAAQLDAPAGRAAGGAELSLRLDVPRAQPEQLRRRWPSWPLQGDLSAHLSARGPAQALRLEAQLSALTSRLDATGEVALSAQPKARLELEARALDARLFWVGAPATELDARGQLTLEKAAGGLLAELQGTTQPTRIAELPVPGSEFALRLEGTKLEGKIELGDARGRLVAQLLSSSPGAARLELRAAQLDLQAWPELQGQVRGRAELLARLDVTGEHVSGTFHGQLSSLAVGAVQAKNARIEGSLNGPASDWQSLEVATSLEARGLSIGALSFETGHFGSQGSWAHSSFDAALRTAAGAKSRVRGKLDVAGTPSFRDLDASWSDRDLELVARVSYCSPAERTLRVTSFQISGAVGKLRGSGNIEADSVDVSLDAEALDTGRLARTFGATRAGLSGRVTGHAALSTDVHATRGNIDLELAGLEIRDLALGTLGLRATLQDRRLVVSLENTESPLGRLDARVTAALGGAVLESSSWQRATGEASVSLKQLPLWPLGLALPKTGPLRDLGGQLDLALQLERSEASDFPSAFLQASTSELSFSLAPDAPGKSPAPVFDQFTLHASGSLDGKSGHGSATLLLTDPRGSLVTSSGSIELELAKLLEHPQDALEQLLHAPLDALTRLHARPLSQLPAAFSVAGLGGSVEGALQLSGSLSEPVLDLALEGRDLLGTGAGSEPLDVTGLLRFVPNGGELTGRAEATRAGKSLVSARLEGRMRNAGSAAPLHPYSLAGWEPSELRAAAMLNGVPLELWPAAAREQAEARLYGSVSWERRGTASSQRAQIEIAALSVHGRALGNGRLTLANDASGSQAELQLGSGEHRLRARLLGAAANADGTDSGLEGSVNAENFEVASLSPLVSGILSQLGGELDADARVQLRRSSGQDWYLGIDGRAELHAASARLDLFGLELRELSARIQARSTPQYTVLLIDPVEAKSRTRRSNVQGDAELWLEGTRVVNGEARLSLNDVPVSLKSSFRGTLRARLEGQLERKSEFMALTVRVPEFRLQLPSASTRSLIAVEPNPDIHVGDAPEAVAPRRSEALLWKMGFELGNSVRVERADLSLPLTGTPAIDFRDEVVPSGSIRLRPGGRITLFDQNFSIDHGSLQFDPEAPDNPHIDVTASWRAPDGTTVFVDITGRAKDASVLTRDDRGLQDVDRFYLLTGNVGTSTGSIATSAGEPGGGEAAIGQTFSLGINQLLRNSLGNVAVSVGTTSDDRASYNASVRVSDRLSFRGSFQPASETKREENTNDLTGSLDYQISRSWSLQTELGTTGGAFDLLWSHRY